MSLRQQCDFWLEAGKIDEAEKQLTQLISNDPSDMEAQTLMGLLYLRKDDTAKAEEVLTKAPNLNRTHPHLAIACAEVYLTSGDIPKARDELEQATNVSSDPLVSMWLAAIYIMVPDYDKAENVLLSVLKSRPDYSPAVRQLLGVDRRISNGTSLIASLRTAIPSSTKNRCITRRRRRSGASRSSRSSR